MTPTPCPVDRDCRAPGHRLAVPDQRSSQARLRDAEADLARLREFVEEVAQSTDPVLALAARRVLS